MYKKITLYGLLIILVLTMFIFTSCSAINAISNKNVDETIFYGTAEAEKVDISAEVSGKLKEIKTQEGQSVKAGDLLAVIDTPENIIKTQQSEISVKSAENELAKINEGSRSEEINAQAALTRQAEAGVEQAVNAQKQAGVNYNAAQTTYDFKKKSYEDTKALYANETVSKQELDNAQYAMDSAQYALNSALYAKETAKQQVDSAKALLAAAQDKLNLLKNGATEKTKNTAQLGIEQAEQGYALSQLTLNKGNITTITEGTVESINYSIGEYVTPGSAVITIVNPSNMWVKIFVPEKTLPSVKLNQEVMIKCDLLKGETIKGKISYISPEAEFTPMNIVTKKDRMKLVFAVKVQLLDHLDQIKPGMLLDVDLDSDKSNK